MHEDPDEFYADDRDDDADCWHEEYDIGWEGSAMCLRCGHMWWATKEQMEAQQEHERQYQEWVAQQERPWFRFKEWVGRRVSSWRWKRRRRTDETVLSEFGHWPRRIRTLLAVALIQVVLFGAESRGAVGGIIPATEFAPAVCPENISIHKSAVDAQARITRTSGGQPLQHRKGGGIVVIPGKCSSVSKIKLLPTGVVVRQPRLATAWINIPVHQNVSISSWRLASIKREDFPFMLSALEAWKVNAQYGEVRPQLPLRRVAAQIDALPIQSSSSFHFIQLPAQNIGLSLNGLVGVVGSPPQGKSSQRDQESPVGYKTVGLNIPEGAQRQPEGKIDTPHEPSNLLRLVTYVIGIGLLIYAGSLFLASIRHASPLIFALSLLVFWLGTLVLSRAV